jgi:integrase/recombinase XerD
MIAAIETYLAVRRTVGFTLSNTEYLLRSFASFATEQKQTHIRTATAIRWASQARSVAQRHVRYQTVCLLAQYLCVEDSRHESPPPNYGSEDQAIDLVARINARDATRLPIAEVVIQAQSREEPLIGREGGHFLRVAD